MIQLEKFTLFMLVITLTNIIYCVNGRSVDQKFVIDIDEELRPRRNVEQIIIEKELVIPSELLTESPTVPTVTETRVEELIPQGTEVPNVENIESEKVEVTPVQDDKEKIRVLHIMLDALGSVNEKALELIRTYIGKLEDKNPPKNELILDSGMVAVEKETSEIPTEKIISKELPVESTTSSKKIPKRPQIVHISQLQGIPQVNPFQAAYTKYKTAVNNLVKKIKTIPQHFIKKISGNGLFFDETQSDATQQADSVPKPDDENNEEKPADETMADNPAEEIMSDKTEDVEEAVVESEASKSNIVGRKLDISNGEILAESETGLNGNTPEEIAEKVKVVLDATRNLNEHSLDLIEVYVDQIIELSNKNSEDEIDARASASEIQEISVPFDTGCDIGYAPIDGICQQVYTPPVVPSNPLVEPISNLIKFAGSILQPIVPRNVAEDIAHQLQIRAEAIVRNFASN